MEETKEALFQQAHELGIEPKEAIEILKRNGIHEKYNKENHKKYLGILSAHSKIMAKLIQVANHKPDNFVPLDLCPICGLKAERDYKNDGALGTQYGWKCTNPDQPTSHFVMDRLERIRPWMQRNQGMSDPETSSETLAETECPSGNGLTESFKNAYSKPPIEDTGLIKIGLSVPDTSM